MRIDKDLYGLKSSGSDWRENISETLNSIVYQYTELDPVVWFKLDVNSSGDQYYKYMLVYVDTIIHLAHDLKEDMYALNCTYALNENIVGPPKRFLEANVEKLRMDNRKQ